MELQIPDLNTSGKSVFNTNSDALGKWVEDLPLINTQATVTRLEFALGEINRFRLPAQERFQALELLTEPVMHSLNALQKNYLGKQFPLSEEQLAMADSAAGLRQAMATGYKILVADLRRMDTRVPALETAIHRAMRHLSEVLIGRYQIYIQYQEGIWRDLHTLYALAEQHHVQAQPVTDITLRKPAATSIGDIYRQILLLSLACPYRLRQKVIREVYDLLHRWAPHSTLTQVQDEHHSGFFACNLASDEPPSYRVLRHSDKFDEQWRYLDTSAMSEPVRTTIEASRSSSVRVTGLPEEQILQRLMLNWGVMPKRRFNRHQDDAPVRLVVGLIAVHKVLTGLDPATARLPEDDPETIHDRHYLQDPTFEKATQIDTGGRNNQPGNLFRGAYTKANQVTNLRIESWKMQDVSAGGYCLLWDSEDVSSAQVGELVAINTTPGEPDEGWQLGVTRWMKFTREQGLALGVQMLSPGAIAVWTRLSRDTVDTGDRMEGILLPEVKALDQQATLLLPALPFRTGCISTLTRAEHDEKIRLTRQIENTGSFAQFHFSPVDDNT